MRINKFRRFAVTTTAIFASVVSIAVAQQDDAKNSPAPGDLDPVAIYVNDHPIYQSAVDEVVLGFIKQQSGGRLPPPDMVEMAREKIEPEVINTLVDQYLLDAAFEKLGLSVSEKEYRSYIESGLDNALRKMNLTRDEYARRMRETRGASLEDAIKIQASDPKYRQSVRVIRVLEKRYPEDMKVTDQQIREQYEAKKTKNYITPEQVRASHILIGTKDLTTDEDKQEAKKKAEKIAIEAKKDGVDFAALAATHSTGPTAQKGGDVGFFPREGAMVRPFADAAFALKVGHVSDVVETRFGYHIIKVTGRSEEKIIPLKDVADWIRYEIQGSRVESLSGAYVSELRAKADVRFP